MFPLCLSEDKNRLHQLTGLFFCAKDEGAAAAPAPKPAASSGGGGGGGLMGEMSAILARRFVAASENKFDCIQKKELLNVQRH